MATRPSSGPHRGPGLGPASRLGHLGSALLAAGLPVLALALALALVAPPARAADLPFTREDVKNYVAERLSELAGRELTIAGDFKVELSWEPTVRVTQVRFANAPWGKAPYLLELDALEVTLDMRALLDGRVILPRLALIGPKLYLETSEDGEANWILRGEEKTVVEATVPDKTPGPLPQVLSLDVSEGELAYRDGSAADPRWIEGRIERAGGRADAETLAFAATGTLAGEPYSLVLRAASLDVLRAGSEPRPLFVLASTGPSQLRAEGTVTAPFELRGLDLQVAASGPGFDRLPLLSGLPESPPFDLELRVVRDAGPWRVERLAGEVGASRLAGTLTYAPADTGPGGRPRVTATLDAQTLALGELLDLVPGSPQETPASEPEARREPEPPSAPAGEGLDLSPLGALDARVAFTADTLSFDAIELSDVQAELVLEDGHLTLAPLAAAAGGGRFSTRLELETRPLSAAAHLRLDGVDLARALAGLGLPGPQLGILDGTLALDLPPPAGEPRPPGAPVDLAGVLRRVRVEEGRLSYRVPGQDTEIALTLAAGGPAPGPRVEIDGRWRGAPVGLAVSAEPLPELLESAPYAIDGQVRLGETRGEIDGALLSPPGLDALRLRFDLDGDLAQLADLTQAPIPTLPRLELKGLLRREGTRWVVEDLQAATAESDLAGRIALDTGPARPQLDADLRIGTLDVPRLAQALGPRQEPATPGGLPPILGEVDGRVDVTAERILLGKQTLQDLDLSGRLKDGRLTLGPIRSTYVRPEAETRIAVDLDPAPGADGPDPGGTLAGTASGRLNGRPIDAEIRLDNRFGLTQGPEGEWTVAVESRATRIALSGTVRDLLTPRDLAVQLSAAAPDTRGLADLLGAELPALPGYAFQARVVRAGPRIAFEDLEGRVGESDLAGRVAVDLKGQEPPEIDARLRSRRLDYDDLTSVLERQVYGRGGREPWEPIFSRKPLGIERIGESLTGQLRLRADSVVARRVPLDELGLEAGIRPGHLDVERLSFGLAGGTVRLRASVDARADPTQVELSGEAARVNLRRALAPFEIADESFGNLAGQLQVWMRGASLAELAGSADGGLLLLMTGGAFDSLLVELAGVDPGEALVQLFDNDPVPIDCAYLNLRSRDGQVDIATLSVDTWDTVFLGEGFVDLDREWLDLTIEPRPKDRSIFTFSSPVRLKGPLTDLGVDVVSAPLVGRSVAAVGLAVVQPLLGLIPLIETGSGDEGRYCGGLMEALKEAAR